MEAEVVYPRPVPGTQGECIGALALAIGRQCAALSARGGQQRGHVVGCDQRQIGMHDEDGLRTSVCAAVPRTVVRNGGVQRGVETFTRIVEPLDTGRQDASRGGHDTDPFDQRAMAQRFQHMSQHRLDQSPPFGVV